MSQSPEKHSLPREEKILDGFRRLGGCRDITSALEAAADLVWAGASPSWAIISLVGPDGSPIAAVRGITPDDPRVAWVRSLERLPAEGLEISDGEGQASLFEEAPTSGFGPAVALPIRLGGRLAGTLAVGFGAEGGARKADRHYLSFVGKQLDLTAGKVAGAESFLRDEETGLRSHVGFLLRLLDEWAACDAKGSPISIVFLEVHSPGGPEADPAGAWTRDAVRKAARILRDETGEIDLLARRDPRTLEILLPQVGASWAGRIAGRIARRIRQEVVTTPSGGTAPMQCFVGVATAPEDAGSPEELLDSVEGKVKAGRRDRGADDSEDDLIASAGQGKALLAMLSRVLEAGWELDSLLDLLVGMLVEIMGAERGFVILQDGDESLTVRTARGRGNHEVETPEKEVSRAITKRVMETGRPILIHDAGTHPLFADSESVVGLGLRAVLCVPIQEKDRTFGCVYLEDRSDPGRFLPSHQDLLVEFARRVSGHLRQSMEFRKKTRKLEEAARRLSGYGVPTDGGGEAYGILGRSASLRRSMELLRKAIPSDLPVHVTGESGTGKELVARAIHFEGPRASGPFVSENCAAIPESIFERELFGHVRGVFTGADSEKPGLIELASGGTLFLDEIGELSPGMQAKILRAIEERGIRRLGGEKWIAVDFRLVTASNRSLEDLIREGQFREDLYYRLEGLTIRLPTLRERKEDIPILVEHFLRREAEKEGCAARRVPREVLLVLLRHNWPGNVRELENTIRRACAVGGEEIRVEDLPRRLREETTYRRFLADPVRPERGAADGDELTRAIEQAGGNKTEAARRLGISKSTLYARLRRMRERGKGPPG